MEANEILHFMRQIEEEYESDCLIVAGDFNAKPHEPLIIDFKNDKYISSYEEAIGKPP